MPQSLLPAYSTKSIAVRVEAVTPASRMVASAPSLGTPRAQLKSAYVKLDIAWQSELAVLVTKLTLAGAGRHG